MDYQSLSQKVQQYIRHYFDTQVYRQLLYHNKAHTENVVTAVIQIGNHYQLNEHDFFVVTTAAWFHDMGYYLGNAAGHEAKGAAMAANFLKDAGVDDPAIEQVQQCILATQMPQKPAGMSLVLLSPFALEALLRRWRRR